MNISSNALKYRNKKRQQIFYNCLPNLPCVPRRCSRRPFCTSHLPRLIRAGRLSQNFHFFAIVRHTYSRRATIAQWLTTVRVFSLFKSSRRGTMNTIVTDRQKSDSARGVRIPATRSTSEFSPKTFPYPIPLRGIARSTRSNRRPFETAGLSRNLRKPRSRDVHDFTVLTSRLKIFKLLTLIFSRPTDGA